MNHLIKKFILYSSPLKVKVNNHHIKTNLRYFSSDCPYLTKVKFKKPRDIESVTQFYIFKIKKQENDIVKKNDIVIEIETGKANMLELAPHDGIIENIFVKIDQEILDGSFMYSVKSLQK